MIARTALVVCAHPDDEALGCGGTMARIAAEGGAVHVLFLADGVGARADGGPDPDALSARRRMGDEAARVLGAQQPIYLDLPDNRLDTVPLLDVIAEVERVSRAIAPDLVMTHFPGDLNVDHRISTQAVVTAFRPTASQSVKAIYAFEVPSSTEWAFGVVGAAFQPNLFVDIGSHLPVKLAALDCYAAEMRSFPHPRSPENVAALARHRGATVGVDAAEAFLLLRMTR